MPAPAFDLQSHSTRSDGELAPAEVVRAAAAAGVELLALTDHDSVDGIDEALAAAREAGIRLSPAAELTALRAPDRDVHVLGYALEHRDPGLAAFLERSRSDRERRVIEMADRLEALGLRVDRREIEARRAAGLSVGRPHLARAVLGAGATPEAVGAFFAEYLVEGARAFVARVRPTVAEAVDAIHGAGGVAVWAHPFHDVPDPAETLAEIERFRADGMDGVECFYVDHDRAATELLCDHCEPRGLLRTGSTDFHGPGHGRYGGFRGFSLYGRRPELGPIGDAA